MGYNMEDMKGLIDESAAHRPEWSSFRDEFIYKPRELGDVLLDWLADSWGFLLAVLAVAVPVVLLVYFIVQESKEWEAFAREHDCQKFATRSGPPTTTYIHMGDMMIPITSPTTETGYRCNDGVEYWR